MFTNMSIRTRLFLGFAIVLLLMIGMGVYSLGRMNLMTRLTNDLYAHPFTVRKAIRDAYLNLMQMNRTLNRMVRVDDAGSMLSDRQTIADLEKKFMKNMEIVREHFHGKQSEVDDLIRAYEQWKPMRDRVITLVASNQRQKGGALLAGIEARLFDTLDEESSHILNFADREASEYFREVQETARMSMILTSMAILAATGILVLVAVKLSRSIVRPLDMAMEVAERVAQGDLTVTVPHASGRDEVNLLLQTFGRMVENLRRQTMEIREGVNVLASSAGQILAATTQVASSAAETASAVNETTATVEEVKQTTQLAAQKARNVAETAQRSLQVSQGGRKAVEESIEGMNRIREQMATIAESIVSLSEQSHAIGEIIATVNDLAEQSNLLAVNASIEAAKAGEHGKGFAVVAHEVKSLADQSKQATAQVRALLNDIQKATNSAVMATEQGSKAVEAGERLVKDAGESIRLLAESIAESANASAQITATTQQQMVGMDQVVLAMENINEASNLSVTGTRQAEISAQNLNELGQKLKHLVEHFRL